MNGRGGFQALVYLLFFVSGLTGLIYQVVWARMFGLVFGNTTQAVSTVLAAFMGGLALGSLLLGRMGDRFGRPVRVYGILEILIGAFAFLFPWLLDVLQGLYTVVFRSFGENTVPLIAIRFVMSFLMVLIPTTLMGGTLPVLSKFAARELPHAGRRIGGLYAVNTFGAVVGTVLAGFFLLELLGVSRSVYLAGGLNLGIGILAVLAAPRAPAPIGEPASGDLVHAPDLPTPSAYARTLVLAVFTISGAIALVYEVLYTRVLVFALGSSTHAFSVMLAAFLVGIAVGSALVARRVDRWRRLAAVFGLVEIGIAVAVVGSIWLLARVDVAEQALGIERMGARDPWVNRSLGFVVAALILLAPTLLLGATFPIVTRFFVRAREHASAAIGRIYFFNTIGAVAGSLAAGFLLVPSLGTVRSFAVAAAGNVLVGLLLLSAGGRRAAWLAATAVAAIGATAALPAIDPALFARTFNIGHEESELVHFREGTSGTVTVHRYPDCDLIAVDGVDVAGTSFLLRITQKLQAHIPVLAAGGHPQRVAHIGFGSGETMRVLTLYDVPRIDGIEICPDIVTTAREFFTSINANAFARPEVHILFMDGKNYVRLTDKNYDVIMTDSVYPGVSAAGSALYTYDHFRAGWEKLRPGGILSCWMPLDVSNRDLKLALRAFHEAFPDMTVWYGFADVTQHALLLGRREAPVELDWGSLSEAWANDRVRDDLAAIQVNDAHDLLSCLLLDSRGVERLCSGIPLNTDDRPRLEFGIARRGLARNYLVANMEEMLRVRADPRELVTGVESAGADRELVCRELDTRVAVSNRLINGHMSFAVRDIARAAWNYEKAVELAPESPVARACLARLEDWQHRAALAAAAGPDDYAVALQAGEQAWAEGHLREAAARFAEAVEQRPGEVGARRRLGECYLRLGDPDAALTVLRVALDLQPEDENTLSLLGVVYEAAGRTAEAKRAYEESIRRYGWNYIARTNLGLIYLGEGDHEKAREQFRAAHQIAPGKPFAAYNIGVSYIQERRWGEAVASLEKAIAIQPSFARAHYDLGVARFGRGDLEGAARAWEKTLELRPGHENARRQLERLGAP